MKQCEQRAEDLPLPSGLVFLEPPRLIPPSPTASPVRAVPCGVNSGRYALDPSHGINKPYLEHELWLASALEKLEGIDTLSLEDIKMAHKHAIDKLQAQLSRFESLKAEEWSRLQAQQIQTRDLITSRNVEIVETGT